MFRAKGWAARAAMAAGLTVGGWTAWATTATAAEPMTLPPGMPSPASPSDSTTSVALGGRDLEMLVEIELLADPATFPHPIKATMGPTGLDLKGFVPNETIQKRAVAIATNIFPAVNDLLKVQPNLMLPVPVVPNAAFMGDAGKRIAQANPRAANRLDVKSTNNGTITLSGNVASVEEKWKMSVALRNMPGCMAIKNDLDAPNAPTIDRDAVIAALYSQSEPTQPGQPMPMPPPEKVLPKTPMPPVEVSKPIVHPTTPTPPVEVSKPIKQPATTANVPAPLLPTAKSPEPEAPKGSMTWPGKPMTKTPGTPVGMSKSPYGGETTAVQPPVMEKKPHEMPKSPVTPVKNEPVTKPSAPAKGEGGAPAIITFDEEPVATPKPAPMPIKPVSGAMPPSAGGAKSASAANLQKQIKANLGATAKDVTVKVNEKGDYEVIVVCQKGYEASAMFQMIKHLPELNDSKTMVEFHPAE